MYADWIAVDWGTSNLRAWCMDKDGSVLQGYSSDQGMAGLKPDEFEGALLALIGEHLAADRKTPIVAAGMVGAKQGWIEAPYAAVPCAPPDGARAIKAPTTDPRLSVHVISGVKQMKPADVMRGEETQIAGYLAERPDFDGVICLPGTHSKWVRISVGEIVSFQTFMTGELFALLSKSSVLRHSITGIGVDEDAFLNSVDDSLSTPHSFGAKLFGIRAASLVTEATPLSANSTLSGLLIGLELAGARPYWLGQEIAIIGASSLAKLYRLALAKQGVKATMVDAENLTLAGLTAAYNSSKEI